MIRTWKLLVLSAASPILFAGSHELFAQGGTDNKAPVDKIKQVEKRLETMEGRFGGAIADVRQAIDRLNSVHEQLDSARAMVDQLGKELVDAKRTLDQLRGERASFYPPDQTSMDAISRRLAKIEQDLARLTNPPRVSQYPAPPAGRLKLINDSAEEMQFVINGRSYRVAPGTAQVIEQMPAGPFRYDVVSPMWGLRASRSTTLAAGETFELAAHY